MGEHVAGSAEHVNMLGVARGDVYIRGYMAPIGAQWLIARSSRTVRTVTQITFTTFIRHIVGFKHTLQSSSSLVVLCAHARGSAALVRVSAGAAGHDAC